MKKLIILILFVLESFIAYGDSTSGGFEYFGENVRCILRVVSNKDATENNWILLLMEISQNECSPESWFNIGGYEINGILLGNNLTQWCWDREKGQIKIQNYLYNISEGRVFLVAKNGNVGQVKEGVHIYKKVLERQKKLDALAVLVLDMPAFILDLTSELKRQDKRISDFLVDPATLKHDDPRQNDERKAEEFFKKMKDQKKKELKDSESPGSSNTPATTGVTVQRVSGAEK